MKKKWKYFLKSLLYNEIDGYIIFDNQKIKKREIFNKIEEFSTVLQTINVKTGAIVYISLPTGYPFLISFFGCLMIGAIPILNSENKINETYLKADLNITQNINTSDIYWVDNLNYVVNNNIKLKISKLKIKSSFFIHTSGSTDKSKCIGISYNNIAYNIKKHRFLKFKSHTLISTLPWTHIFGLFFDLFLALEFKLDIYRLNKPEDIYLIPEIKNRSFQYYINGVPKFFEEIFLQDNGNILSNVEGGVIGGAKISSDLAKSLEGSNFRVGYGQTEATPGILMGEKGEFYPNYLGKKIGINVKIKKSNLFFKGENAFRERILQGKILSYKKNRWVNSNDICKTINNKFFYIGRSDFSFKLKNGKMIYVEELESNVIKELRLIYPIQFGENNLLGIYLMIDKKEEMKKDLIINILPDYIKSEKIKIIFVSEWSKDSKGNLNRKKMIEDYLLAYKRQNN